MHDLHLLRGKQPLGPVLLVEDDMSCAELLITMLGDAPDSNADISFVSSLNEARQILCEEKFDLIILGLNLQDSRGVDTIDTVTMLAHGAPIIVVSAEQDPGLILSMLQRGAQDFISKLKMLDIESFFRRIEFALARAAHQHEVIRRAHFDQLTALPNRYLFKERLDAVYARSRRIDSSFSLFMVDLNGFKPINDTFGHDAGDAVLTEIGRRLNRTFRDKDTVARLGGDEFCIVIDDDNENTAGIIRKKIHDVITQPYSWCGKEIKISASIGAGTYPHDAETIDGLIKYADLAMYSDKQDH